MLKLNGYNKVKKAWEIEDKVTGRIKAYAPTEKGAKKFIKENNK